MGTVQLRTGGAVLIAMLLWVALMQGLLTGVEPGPCIASFAEISAPEPRWERLAETAPQCAAES